MSAEPDAGAPTEAVTVHRVLDAELRFGDWGPGYLVQDEDAAFGTLVLRPGDAFANHLHEHHTESFLVLEGEVEVWLDRTHQVRLTRLELLQARPGVEHLVRTVGDASARLLFIKTPAVDGDKVDRPWTPSAA